MLRLLDIFLTFFHLIIIGFILFGWIWPATRKMHFICVLATAASWLLLGLWFGVGYCPVTDWQWQVKAKLGEHDLPASFITVSYTHLRAHETRHDLVCRLLLEKKKKKE